MVSPAPITADGEAVRRTSQLLEGLDSIVLEIIRGLALVSDPTSDVMSASGRSYAVRDHMPNGR